MPISFVAMRLADALASNLASGTAVPFGLLQVAEVLGLGPRRRAPRTRTRRAGPSASRP